MKKTDNNKKKFRYERTWDGLPISSDPPFGAVVVVHRRIKGDREFLLLHRCNKKEDERWSWGPPAGARLPNESIEACVKRELFEETGLKLPCSLLSKADEDWYIYFAEANADCNIQLSREHDRFVWLPEREAIIKSSPEIVQNQLVQVAEYLKFMEKLN